MQYIHIVVIELLVEPLSILLHLVNVRMKLKSQETAFSLGVGLVGHSILEIVCVPEIFAFFILQIFDIIWICFLFFYLLQLGKRLGFQRLFSLDLVICKNWRFVDLHFIWMKMKINLKWNVRIKECKWLIKDELSYLYLTSQRWSLHFS